MNILEALAKLETENDEHWTAQGLPQMKALKEMTGIEDLTRPVVDQAAPDYTRTNRFDIGVVTASGGSDPQQPVEPGDVDPEEDADQTNQDSSPPDPGAGQDQQAQEPEAIHDDREEQKAKLLAEIDEIRERRDALAKEKISIENEIRELDGQMQVAEMTKEALFPPLSHAEVVQQYNNKQIEVRMDAAKRRQAAAAALGHDAVEGGTAGMSNLDRREAMRRRNARVSSGRPSQVHS